MKIINVCGARPNFMKIAALARAFGKCPEIETLLVHTGQHYDQKMSHLFFEQLEIPRPDINLEVGSGSHAVQTAEIMKRFEAVCLEHKPTHVLVVGDVNSTIACALVAAKLGIRVIHVEAGLRSFDRTMPEEINRVLTDQISDLLFVSEESGVTNLSREGVPAEKVHLVGNVMIDTLLNHRVKAEQSNILADFGLSRNGQAQPDHMSRLANERGTAAAGTIPYLVVTLHRPANVDRPDVLGGILSAIQSVSEGYAVVFPVHPRTMQRIRDFGLDKQLGLREVCMPGRCLPGLINCVAPLGYLEFLKLMANAKLVVTDSGGIQEETTVLGVPCVTVRENTERPITLTYGTNRLVGADSSRIIQGCRAALEADYSQLQPPPLWDGHAAERIVGVLLESSRK